MEHILYKAFLSLAQIPGNSELPPDDEEMVFKCIKRPNLKIVVGLDKETTTLQMELGGLEWGNTLEITEGPELVCFDYGRIHLAYLTTSDEDQDIVMESIFEIMVRLKLPKYITDLLRQAHGDLLVGKKFEFLT